MNSQDLRKVKIDCFTSPYHIQDALQEEQGARALLKGGKILDIGNLLLSYGDNHLAIDFEKDDKIFRVVLGYNELGMWVEYSGEKIQEGKN